MIIIIVMLLLLLLSLLLSLLLLYIHIPGWATGMIFPFPPFLALASAVRIMVGNAHGRQENFAWGSHGAPPRTLRTSDEAAPVSNRLTRDDSRRLRTSLTSAHVWRRGAGACPARSQPGSPPRGPTVSSVLGRLGSNKCVWRWGHTKSKQMSEGGGYSDSSTVLSVTLLILVIRCNTNTHMNNSSNKHKRVLRGPSRCPPRGPTVYSAFGPLESNEVLTKC